jgi:hypothetical protein
MRQLIIDSRDRVTGSTTDFTIQLRETLTTTAANSYRIDNLRIPLVIPLIQRGVNDVLWFYLGGVVRHVTLTYGNYSGVDLATEIQYQLSTTFSPVTWSVKYNNATAALSIASSDATFSVMTDAQVTAAGYSLPTFASALFKNAYTVDTFLGSRITWSFCSMIAVDMMYLSSNKLASQDTFGPSGATDTIMAAVTEGDFASVLNSSMPQQVWLNTPAMTTSTLDFQLRARDYSVLQNLPNISFVLTIR